MSSFIGSIAPHGGQLINRIATAAEKAEFLAQADTLPRVQLDERATSDLVMIAIGGFSPLKGFMEQEDYELVVEEMHLKNGLPWAVPVTLSVSEEVAAPLKEGNWVRLDDPQGNFVGLLELTQKYHYVKAHEAVNVYRTDDEKHPGVKVVYEQGPVNLAGPIWLVQRDPHPLFPAYQIDPAQSRQAFVDRGWQT
ncbi:MAG: sulfate adenylyltransferase, partial [Microcystaceae cyanobacterium]